MFNNVVFLDRDGVINQDSENYIKRWSEFRFIPQSIEAIVDLTRQGCPVFIITNQSAVNRGMMSGDDLEHIHSMMKTAVSAKGGLIQDIFFCPHRPDEDCNCRKPKPGLFFKARQAYGLDLAGSVMVGDSEKDIKAAAHAGCGASVLVRTGNGIKAAGALAKKNHPPDHIAENLYDAAEWIITDWFKK